MAMGSKAFESPLISHVRMRTLFRALVEVRGLARRLKERSMAGVEACWVAASIDLKDVDIASYAGGALEPLFVQHIRSIGQRAAGGALKTGEARRVLKLLSVAASDEAPGVFPGNVSERMVCAVGSAMALQAGGRQGLVLAFVRRDELSAVEWRRLFVLMGQRGLPLIVLAVPGDASKLDLEDLAMRSATRVGLAVPVIPVDAGDAVALYRVMQESMVRARAGGGSAVIAGVRCGSDAVGLLGSQLVSKRICTQRWVSAVSEQVDRLMAVGAKSPR